MRRYWSEVAVQTGDAADPRFRILLDGKPVRLPTGAPLALSHRRLADAIAAEWRHPATSLTTDDLKLTALAGAAIERVAADPAPLCSNLLAYGRTDLLCYRASAPPGLAARQHAEWQPWLDWAEHRFGATLHTTTGIAAITQPETAIARLHATLTAQDNWTLAALGAIVPALGSLVLGLAATSGALAAAAAHNLAQLDQTWQEQHWGIDAEAEAQRRAVAAEIASAVEFVTLTR